MDTPLRLDLLKDAGLDPTVVLRIEKLLHQVDKAIELSNALSEKLLWRPLPTHWPHERMIHAEHRFATYHRQTVEEAVEEAGKAKAGSGGNRKEVQEQDTSRCSVRKELEQGGSTRINDVAVLHEGCKSLC